MLKKLAKFTVAAFMVAQLCGCVMVMAGLADSAKAKQDLDITYSQALDVVKAALKTTDVQFENAVIRKEITQVKGKYKSGREARIFISRVNDYQSRIAVRVGTSEAGREDAQKILNAIINYYNLTYKGNTEPSVP